MSVPCLEDLIEGVDHLAVAVVDIEESIRWFSQGLGFRMVERRITHGETTGMESAVMIAGNAIVVLVQGISPDSQVSRFIEHFGSGVQHVAFSVKDIDEASARIRAAGGDLDVEITEEAGIRQAFLRRDPGSGVRVELIERRGGKFTDSSVEFLFRELERKKLY